MGELFDLIVVGGGLGGAALARSLAENGARVLVIERDDRFRDRVRGEMMTPWGVAEAENLGIAELLRGRCGHELPWVDFFSGNVLVAHRPVAATTPQQRDCLAFYHPAMCTVSWDGIPNCSWERDRKLRRAGLGRCRSLPRTRHDSRICCSRDRTCRLTSTLAEDFLEKIDDRPVGDVRINKIRCLSWR
jgi:hypothetical protein